MSLDPTEYSLRQDLNHHLSGSVPPSESSPEVTYVRAFDLYNIHADALIFMMWRLSHSRTGTFMEDFTSAGNEYMAALRYGDEESEFHSEMVIYKLVAGQQLGDRQFLSFNSLFLRYKDTAKALLVAERAVKEAHKNNLADA